MAGIFLMVVAGLVGASMEYLAGRFGSVGRRSISGPDLYAALVYVLWLGLYLALLEGRRIGSMPWYVWSVAWCVGVAAWIGISLVLLESESIRWGRLAFLVVFTLVIVNLKRLQEWVADH